MFTIENFIHGIANVTKSLKASICGDSLIVNRICYDYETSNDYEELFAQISLEQIQPIIELLADNYICTDKMLIKNDYIEIAVQSQDRNRPTAFMRLDRDSFEVTEHNYVIASFITRPSFSPYRYEDIHNFYNVIKKKMRDQRDDGVWNERNGLLLCLKRYIPDLSTLKASIVRIDSSAIDYYRTTSVPFTDDGKLIDFEDESERVYSSIRDRIYATRNAVVHSKYGERLRYEPFKHDKHLGKEIPLMRAVAEEIIISSADRINYSFVDPTHSLP